MVAPVKSDRSNDSSASRVAATFENIKGKTKEQEATDAAKLAKQTKEQATRANNQPKAKDAMEKGDQHLNEQQHHAEAAHHENIIEQNNFDHHDRVQQNFNKQQELTQKNQFITRETIMHKAKEKVLEQQKDFQRKEVAKTATGGWSPITNRNAPPSLKDPTKFLELKKQLPPPSHQVNVNPSNLLQNKSANLLPQFSTRAMFLGNNVEPRLQAHFAKLQDPHIPQTPKEFRAWLAKERGPFIAKDTLLKWHQQGLRESGHNKTVEPHLANFQNITAHLSKSNPNKIQIVLRQNTVLVRDGDKLRAFRILKDGSLVEIPSDDASDTDLSPEAKEFLQKTLGKKNLGSKLSAGGEEHLGELTEEAQLAKNNAEAAESSPLDFETLFALTLHEVLQEERKVGYPLEGDNAIFLTKEDWLGFLKSMLGMGNVEKKMSKSLSQLLDFVFRGIFKNSEGQWQLIGDLKFMQDAKAKEEKFIQLHLSSDELLSLLENHQPGEKFTSDLFKKIFGEDLQYIKLAHTEPLDFNMDADAKFQFDPKKSYDPQLQNRLEQRIFKSLEKNKPAMVMTGESAPSAQNNPNGFVYHVYELLNVKKRFAGHPKIWVFLSYFLMIAFAVLLFMQFFGK